MKKSGTKTGLFLLELVIALLLFAFCAAICVQIFVGAKFRTRDSEALSKSVFLASSAAELYKAYGGDLDKMRGAYGEGHSWLRDGLLSVYYDENWNETIDPLLDSTLLGGRAAYVLEVGDLGGAEAEIAVFERSGLLAPASEPETEAAGKIYGITVKAVGAGE
ncbi:MAG: hypothetical protein LBD92_06920 [Oscillospiraceae bacterium]|jgi:hypothetical protein|nr:hypothetical protein [Oscillospiraceae bacterium]